MIHEEYDARFTESRQNKFDGKVTKGGANILDESSLLQVQTVSVTALFIA